MKRKKHLKTTYEGYAIMNHVGSFWSHNYFNNADEAVKYIQIFQKNFPACNLSKHKVIRVKMTLQQVSD